MLNAQITKPIRWLLLLLLLLFNLFHLLEFTRLAALVPDQGEKAT